MKDPDQKTVINFGTGSPEGNGGPYSLCPPLYVTVELGFDHHMKNNLVLPNAKRFKRNMREVFGISELRERI
jgi:hypothetical protein